MIEMIESPGIRRDRERWECFERLFKEAMKKCKGIISYKEMRQSINREYMSVPVAGERRYLSNDEFLDIYADYKKDLK